MISVIILSKNNGDTLDACLKSVISSLGEKEIIVVDAHSSDNTPSILEKYKNHIKVVYDEGKGIGLARNIGVLHSKGDIICFVDADAFVSKDHFVKIKECFDRHPEVGIARAHTFQGHLKVLAVYQDFGTKLNISLTMLSWLKIGNKADSE